MKPHDEALLRKLQRYLANAKRKNVSREQMVKMMEDEVFSQPDFKRHILETSLKLKLPRENVETVVKHFLMTMAFQMTLVTRVRRRLSIYAFFMIEIKDEYAKAIIHKKEVYEKKFGKRVAKQLLEIFN